MLSLFQKDLKDVVLNYRRSNDKKAFAAQTIQEVKKDLSNQDFDKKKKAAEILIFLYLEGIPIDFAGFNCIQLMSGKKLDQRRIGFMVGSIALREKNDILLLTGGTFKKIFVETFAPQNISIGLNCLSIVCNEELSEILHEDIVPLFSSNSAMVRRKACATCYKLILCYPEASTTLSSYLSDALDDVSPAVQTAVVTVILELSRTSPKMFLLTVPKLFELFKCENNWLIIKLIKVMHEIIKVENRMIGRLTKTYLKLLNTTRAKSVEIDLIREVIINFRSKGELYTLAKEKIGGYFDSGDNNLIYLGLSAIKCLMKYSTEDAKEFKDKIVKCFSKSDITIRRAALQCIQSFVTKENVKDIVNDILQSIEELEYGIEDRRIEEDSRAEESKNEDEKLDDEEETLSDIHKRRVIKKFSDSDKSYRDLQIKTALAILIDNNYEILDGDFQWCVEIMIKLGVYTGPRINRLLAETLRQLYIKLDDHYKKDCIDRIINSLLQSVSLKKDKEVLKYSYEFLEALIFITSQNSAMIGATNSSKILEYFRRFSQSFVKSLPITKASLCELIFRCTFIELQNNLKTERDADILLDRVKLFEKFICNKIDFQLALDMRQAVYLNILKAVSAQYQDPSAKGNSGLLLEYIGDLEGFFTEEIEIGGSKRQNAIQPPDCLDQEFFINETEFAFEEPKQQRRAARPSEEASEDANSNTPTEVTSSVENTAADGNNEESKNGD